MQYQEREVNLRDYFEIILKRKWTILLSILVVATSSIIFVPTKTLVYKATAFVIVEGSPYNAELIEAIKRFAKTHTLAEEIIHYLDFEKAKTIKAKGELSESLAEANPTNLLSSILIEQEEGSDVLAVNVLSGIPKEATDIANITARIVVEQSFKGIASGTQSSIKYIEKQMEILRREIEDAKQSLSNYTTTQEGAALALPGEAKDFEKLQQDYVNAKLSRQLAEAKLKVLEEKLASKKPQEDIISILPQSKEMAALKAKMAQLQQHLGELLVQFTEEHPKVIETQMEIEKLNEDIQKEAVKPMEELRQQIAEYKNAEDTAKKVLEARFPVISTAKEGEQGNESKAQQLTRELSLDEKTYNRLSEEKEKLRLDSVLNATKVRILRLATEPKKPEKPQGMPAIIIAISLGCVLGLSAAFLQENIDSSLKTLEDIEYYLKKPIVGVIPFIRTDAKKRSHHRQDLR
jgi:uncharacterized protein involved in exopolysaccharide biosynthesis